MSATPSISPDPCPVNPGRYPPGTGRVDVPNEPAVRAAVDGCSISLFMTPQGRVRLRRPRYAMRTRPWDTELFGPPPRQATPRRRGPRASRVARVAARRAAAKSAGGDSGDEPPGDGDPPDRPPIAIERQAEGGILIPGVGGILWYEDNSSGFLIIEACAFSDGEPRTVIERRKEILNAVAARLFGADLVEAAQRRAEMAS